MTPSRPSRVFRFVNTNGFSPRMRRASRAMTPRSAPTNGARSILLMSSRSERGTPGPPLRGVVSRPAALEKHQGGVGKPGVRLVHGLEIDRRVLADRRVRAAAGLDADDAI